MCPALPKPCYRRALQARPSVVDSLRSLHPQRSSLPVRVPSASPHIAVDEALLGKLIASQLKNGSAGGPSGWTGELVAPLVDDAECLRGLAALVRDIINGELDAHARSLLMASLLIPGAKAGGGVRPIAISESFYKLSTIYAISLVRDSLPGLFEPIQLGVGAKGGSERALHLIQAGLETMSADSILLKCDIRNAVNERKRDQILKELYRTAVLRPLWRLSHWAYKDVSELLVFIMASIVTRSSHLKGSNRVIVLVQSCSLSLCSQFIAGAFRVLVRWWLLL